MEKRKMTVFVLGFYLFLLVWLVLFKLTTDFNMLPHYQSINLIPFAQSVIVNGKIYIKEIIYNALAFVPLGVYIQYWNPAKAIWKKAGIGFLVSLSLETIQFIFKIGSSDITDIISNTFGVILGLGLYKLLEKIFKKDSIKVVNILGLAIESSAVFLILFLSYVNK